MATSIPALVEPLVLRWARESVGLSPLAAARRLGVPDDRVELWEQGQAQPTISQLRKAASVYKRPLGVFFLAQPPQDFDAMRDFRRHVDATGGQWSPELHGEYRRAQLQRENALELFELEDDQPPTTWRIDDVPDDPEATGALARARLLAHAVVPLPSGVGTSYDHLNAWTAALEEAGVLVFATSRGGVSPSEMRAFSLYFDVLPIIVANGADGARGRLFSMLHEYAHLVLHTAGLCDTVTDFRATTPNRELEARCNAIAAAILMPAGDVLFLVAYEEEEARPKASGGNWYRNTARDLGKGYVRRIADAYRRRVIDSYTAASYLNVKVDQIPRLAQEAALQVSAQR